MNYTTCASCKASVIEALAEPDAKVRHFDPSPKTLWRVVSIAEHAAAIPTAVHELHRCNPNDVALTTPPATT